VLLLMPLRLFCCCCSCCKGKEELKGYVCEFCAMQVTDTPAAAAAAATLAAAAAATAAADKEQLKGFVCMLRYLPDLHVCCYCCHCRERGAEGLCLRVLCHASLPEAQQQR
jgi:hypothetical protein